MLGNAVNVCQRRKELALKEHDIVHCNATETFNRRTFLQLINESQPHLS